MPDLVPAAPVPRPPSPALSAAMVAVRRAWSQGGAVAPLPDALRAEASRRLAACEAALSARCEVAELILWVGRVITLIGHPSTADAVEEKIAAIVPAIADLPRRCITAESAAAVANAAGRYFPPLAELREVAAGKAGPLRLEAAALRALLRAAPQAEDPPDEWTPAAALARVARLEASEPGPITGIAARALLGAIGRHCPDVLAEAEPRLAALIPAAIAPDPAPRTARQRAEDPHTSADDLRAIVAAGGPGATLARMKLQAIASRKPLA
jgi:hypothetical protein